jgi:hypothetical protein
MAPSISREEVPGRLDPSCQLFHHPISCGPKYAFPSGHLRPSWRCGPPYPPLSCYGSHPDNPGPPLDTYSHCHLSSNTEALITRATGPAALVGLLPTADNAFRHRCPRRWYGATYHTRTPPASGGLSNSSVLRPLAHMPATFTLVAIASFPPLLSIIILATVLFLDILVMWRFRVQATRRWTNGMAHTCNR